MAIDYSIRYPDQTDTDVNYPQGKARNKSTPAATDGTPFEEDYINDQWGFFQALLKEAGITPSGNADNANSSDYLSALKAIQNNTLILKVFQTPTDNLTKVETFAGDVGVLFEVRRNSDNALASLYLDEEGNSPLSQNGSVNRSDADGKCIFYIVDGEYYITINFESAMFTVGFKRSHAISVSGIKTLEEYNNLVEDDQKFDVTGFYSGTSVGGGLFVWKSSESKSNHNGITIISPEAISAWEGDNATLESFLNWTGSGSGSGCFVREEFSAFNLTWTGNTGTSSEGDKESVKKAVASTTKNRDLNGTTSVAMRLSHNGISSLTQAEIDWPLNTAIDYQGPTGELATMVNYISTPYQVLPVITDPWLPDTTYTLGLRRVNGGQAYKVVGRGISASSGGPTGTGSTITDGTVTWKSINNGLFAGVPVNERRIHAPYHPALILDQKSPVSYGGFNQDAHDYVEEYEAAGGDSTGEYKSIIWSQDGNADWQFVGDSKTDTLSMHKLNAGQLWRQFFNSANGDMHIQHHDSLGIGDSSPLDVAGGFRVFTDTSLDGNVRTDNKNRFTSPEITLRKRDNLGGDNSATLSLTGTNGKQLQISAPDNSGLNGETSGDLAFVTQKSTGETTSIRISGFFQSLEPLQDSVTSLGRAGMLWSEVFSATGTINTSDARVKTEVVGLTEDELNASKQLCKEIGTYKFLSAIELKGDDARVHIGMTVQRAIDIMEENNLNPFNYGFICYDEWDEEVVDHEAVYEYYTEVVGGVEEERKRLVKDAYSETITEAGNSYAFRYDELNQFILAGISARLDALEV